jgi:hypothetical protein
MQDRERELFGTLFQCVDASSVGHGDWPSKGDTMNERPCFPACLGARCSFFNMT